MDSNYAVNCGIDVGEGEHHAVGLTAAGKKIYDKALPNDEAKLWAVFDRLASHGSLLVVVDQPSAIGALPVTVARVGGHDVGYLPGLAMRRIAELEVLLGFDDDLACEATRVSNRIRGMLTPSTPPSSGSSDPASPIRRCSRSSPAAAGQPESGRPASASSPRSVKHAFE
jgi:hypothetical protein